MLPKIVCYLAEIFCWIVYYLAELFCQIVYYLTELFCQIASPQIYFGPQISLDFSENIFLSKFLLIFQTKFLDLNVFQKSFFLPRYSSFLLASLTCPSSEAQLSILGQVTAQPPASCVSQITAAAAAALYCILLAARGLAQQPWCWAAKIGWNQPNYARLAWPESQDKVLQFGGSKIGIRCNLENWEILQELCWGKYFAQLSPNFQSARIKDSIAPPQLIWRKI